MTPLVSMIDLTHLSPFILNHRSNETGPFRGTGLFYLFIGQEARYLDSGCSVIAWVIYGYLFC